MKRRQFVWLFVAAMGSVASLSTAAAGAPAQVALLAGPADDGRHDEPIPAEPVISRSAGIDHEIARMRNEAEVDVQRGFYSLALARYQGVARLLREDIERLGMTLEDVVPTETERVRTRLGHRTDELSEVQTIVRLLGLQ
jgi:hypothetical protein